MQTELFTFFLMSGGGGHEESFEVEFYLHSSGIFFKKLQYREKESTLCIIHVVRSYFVVGHPDEPQYRGSKVSALGFFYLENLVCEIFTDTSIVSCVITHSSQIRKGLKT